MERLYSVQYNPLNATVNDPVLSITVSAVRGIDIWKRAHALGFVHKISDLSVGGTTVYSKHWDFNLIGLDQALLMKENFTGA